MTKRRSIPDAAVPDGKRNDGRFKRWACGSAENAGPEYTYIHTYTRLTALFEELPG